MSDTIFVQTTGCPGCNVVKQALARNPRPIAIRAIDGTDRDAILAFQRLGVQAVPAASIGGRTYVGAGPILAALGIRA